MTLQQLHYALALKKTGSFVQAARQTGISQPGLSAQIKKLEEELDFLLFDRSKKRIEATDRGLIFLERAQLLLNEARQLRSLGEQLAQEVSGTLRVGVIPTLAPYLLPLFINQLNTHYANLKIRIKEALTEEIIRDLRSGELDGGIISTPIQSKTVFETLPLFYEPFKLFVSSNHPLFAKAEIQVEEIDPQDIWLLKEGNCFRDQVNNICEINRDRRERELFYFESNSIESLCHIVEFKGGVTFLPELTTIYLDPDKEDMVKELAGERRVREVSLLHLPNHIRSAQLAQLAQVITANIPRNLLHQSGAVTIPTRVKV